MSTSGELKANKTHLFQWEVDVACFDDKTVGDSLISPKFSTGGNDWQLRLYPKCELKEEKGYLSLFLEQTTPKEDVCVEFYFLLLNKENQKVNLNLHKAIFKQLDNSWGGKLAKESFIRDLQKDNKLRLWCNIIMEKNCSENKDETPNGKSVSRLKEFDSFEDLFINQEFSNVTIKVQDNNFQLHKCILSTRSPVFKAMFANDMKEKHENTVEIEDVKYEVLKELFRFIYTGKVNCIENIVDDLLIASEKYCINGLKELCERTICIDLEQENAIKYLNLAIMNNAEILKAEAINLVSLYLDVFIDKKELIDLDRDHPGVLHEITKKYISNHQGF